MTVRSLGERIKVLESIEAIKELKYTYCYCLDTGNMDKAFDVFTEDATLDIYGKVKSSLKGREQIAKHTGKNIPEKLPFTVHTVSNPIIKVNGDEAKGTWYLWSPATRRNGEEQAIINCGRYDDEYVKVKGKWKIKHSEMRLFFASSYEKGWVKDPILKP